MAFYHFVVAFKHSLVLFLCFCSIKAQNYYYFHLFFQLQYKTCTHYSLLLSYQWKVHRMWRCEAAVHVVLILWSWTVHFPVARGAMPANIHEHIESLTKGLEFPWSSISRTYSQKERGDIRQAPLASRSNFNGQLAIVMAIAMACYLGTSLKILEIY
jgi:hypothetical protein